MTSASTSLDATQQAKRIAAPFATERIAVCIVAPKHMVGGQAVSAQSLMAGFADDPSCRISLQPIDPPLPRWLRGHRGLRTLARMPIYLAGLLRNILRADVVHVYTAGFSPFALTTTPAILLARLLRRPVLLNYHDGRAARHLRSRWARWVLRRANAFVFPSTFLRDVFARYGMTGDVIPNVVDSRRFQFRGRVPLRPLLISCRLLEELYAVENTLRAFRLIRACYPEAQLTVIGAGDQEGRLRSLVNDEHIEGITFCGRIAHAAVPEYYDRADIWVNSSREDNMPLSMIEAFSSGLPVVTTDVGGIPRIVEHERNGLLVPCDDPAALAAAVLRLLDDERLTQRLVAEARRDCLQRYSWESAHLQWRSLYQRLSRYDARAAAAVPESRSG